MTDLSYNWEERGCPNDSAGEDWFRAEAEIQRITTVREDSVSG
jgi:hypothetical protein